MKGRPRQSHCRHGHELTPDNVVLIPRKDRMQRRCGVCLQRYNSARERKRRTPGKIEALVLERNQLRDQVKLLQAASPNEGWREAIYAVLRSFHLSNMVDRDMGGGYPLVDLCSNDGAEITTGEEQLRDLAGEIAEALHSKASDTRDDEPCEKCGDSGYAETYRGGIWTGENVGIAYSICDCACGLDVRRERAGEWPHGRSKVSDTTQAGEEGLRNRVIEECAAPTDSPDFQAVFMVDSREGGHAS